MKETAQLVCYITTIRNAHFLELKLDLYIRGHFILRKEVLLAILIRRRHSQCSLGRDTSSN